jgi:hypothetical protein
MTTATQMTPAEFLESDLYSHPGFASAGDPRRDRRLNAGEEDPTLSLPNLAELIRRIGGIDAIPDHYSARYAGSYFEGPWVLEGGRDSVLELSRWGARRLEVAGWHPRCPSLVLMFDLPGDWSGQPWRLSLVMGEDLHPTDSDLERLAARALDHHVGEILDGSGRFEVDGEPFVP